MEPRVFAFGTKIISFQCTFHVIEAISASSLKCLETGKKERKKKRIFFSTCWKEFKMEDGFAWKFVFTRSIFVGECLKLPRLTSPLIRTVSTNLEINRIKMLGKGEERERETEKRRGREEMEANPCFLIERQASYYRLYLATPYLYMNTEPTKRKTTIELKTIERIAYPGRAGAKENTVMNINYY